MEAKDVNEIVADMRHQVVARPRGRLHAAPHPTPSSGRPRRWRRACKLKLGLDLPVLDWAAEEGVDQDAHPRAHHRGDRHVHGREGSRPSAPTRCATIEKQVLLQTIDAKWREHLLRLEHLRSVVGFRGYAQRDPLNEYKTESFQLFENLLDGAARGGHAEAVRASADDGRGKPGDDAEPPAAPCRRSPRARAWERRPSRALRRRRRPGRSPRPGRWLRPWWPLAPRRPRLAPGTPREGFDEKDPTTWGNPSRNDPCPCGSGQKFKHCHGAF